MPARKLTAGPRFTPPSVKAADIGDGSCHHDDLARRMRQAAVSDRLGLGAVAGTPLPASLRCATRALRTT